MIELTADELNKPARISTRAEWKDRLKIRQLDFTRLKKGETQLMSELFDERLARQLGFVPFTSANSIPSPTR